MDEELRVKPIILITSEANELHGTAIRAMCDDDVEVIVQDSIKHPLFEDGSIEAVSCGGAKHVNVGTIGHVDHGKASLSQAIDKCLNGEGRRNKSDRKRNRKNRWS